jgi:hypothetical protein
MPVTPREAITDIRRAEARKAQKAQQMINQEFARKIFSAGIAASLLQFWFAQLIIWGLSMYHVHSGIWGPWLIMEGVSSMGVTVVALGMMRAVRDIQNINRQA